MIAKVRRYEYADILDIYAEFEKLSRAVRIIDTVRLMKKSCSGVQIEEFEI